MNILDILADPEHAELVKEDEVVEMAHQIRFRLEMAKANDEDFHKISDNATIYLTRMDFKSGIAALQIMHTAIGQGKYCVIIRSEPYQNWFRKNQVALNERRLSNKESREDFDKKISELTQRVSIRLKKDLEEYAKK